MCYKKKTISWESVCIYVHLIGIPSDIKRYSEIKAILTSEKTRLVKHVVVVDNIIYLDNEMHHHWVHLFYSIKSQTFSYREKSYTFKKIV